MHTVGENIIGAHKMQNYYLHFCLLFGIISLPLCFISLSLVIALPTMAKAKLSLFLALKGNRNKFIFAFAIAFMDDNYLYRDSWKNNKYTGSNTEKKP